MRMASAVVLAALGARRRRSISPGRFLVLVMVGGGLVAWEWGRLTRGNGFDGTALIQAVSVCAVAILRLGWPRRSCAVRARRCGRRHRRDRLSLRRRACWPLAGLAYAALPAAALIWLRSDPSLGAAAVLYLFAVAWTTDTASYVAGRLIGGPKLAPAHLAQQDLERVYRRRA